MIDAAQTGRTYRMLQYAKQESDRGQKVVVYFTSRVQAKHFQKLLDSQGYSGIKCSTPTRHFDWANLNESSIESGAQLLFDHGFIEENYGRMLTELHRFDYPCTELSLKYRAEVMASYG